MELNDKQKQKLLRLAKIADKGEVGIAEELNSLDDRVDTVDEKATEALQVAEDAFKREIPQGEQGIQGEKGDKGDKGDAGKDGKNGVDGKDGLDGVDGKNGSPDTAQDIADKLNQEEEIIDQKVIIGLQKRLEDTTREIGTKAGWGAHPLRILDDGVIIDKVARTINFTGGTVSRSADGTINVAHPSTSPGGSDTQVQFNDGGSFGGDAGLTYNKTTNALTAGDVLVDDEVYGAGWNASLEVPTKNALYDKLELFALGTGIDHGGLTGLADDDHTQYALLAGRSGNQVLIGGTSTTGTLTLQSTSGVGTTGADIIFKTGNNGATEAGRITNGALWGINSGSLTPQTSLNVWGSPIDAALTTSNLFGQMYVASTDTSPVQGNGGTIVMGGHGNSYYRYGFIQGVHESGNPSNAGGRVRIGTYNGSSNVLKQAIMIDSSQNVGIGNGFNIYDSLGTNLLYVKSTTANDSYVLYETTGSSNQSMTVTTRATPTSNNGRAIFSVEGSGSFTYLQGGIGYYTAGFTLKGRSTNANPISYNLGVYGDGSSTAKFGIDISNNGAGTSKSNVFMIDGTGNIGMGTASPSALLHLIKTTEQLRVGYDTSNYYSTTVGSTGGVTFDAVGSGARFTFSDSLALPYRAITALRTLDNTDYTVDCTANTFTVTLPTAVGITGCIYNIKNTGIGVITIATTSSQTIDGNASGALTLVQWDNLTVQSTGSNWIII